MLDSWHCCCTLLHYSAFVLPDWNVNASNCQFPRRWNVEHHSPSLGKRFQDTAQSVTRKVIGYVAWGSVWLGWPIHNALPSLAVPRTPWMMWKNKLFPLCALSWVVLLNFIPVAIFLHSYMAMSWVLYPLKTFVIRSYNSSTSSQRPPFIGHLYPDLKALPMQKGCTALALLA